MWRLQICLKPQRLLKENQQILTLMFCSKITENNESESMNQLNFAPLSFIYIYSAFCTTMTDSVIKAQWSSVRL